MVSVLVSIVSVPCRKECGTWQGPYDFLLDWWTCKIREVWTWQEEGLTSNLNLSICGYLVSHCKNEMNAKVICTFISLQVSVYPREVQPENPNSYRARKREYFRLQRERKKARKEGIIAQPQLVLASTDASESNPACWFPQAALQSLLLFKALMVSCRKKVCFTSFSLFFSCTHIICWILQGNMLHNIRLFYFLEIFCNIHSPFWKYLRWQLSLLFVDFAVKMA